MDAIKRRLKATALFLTALLLFQSCVVYHKTPTTLEKASQEQTKTKVTNTNDEKSIYKYITYENGIFYGVNKKSGELIKTPLDKDYISMVLTKNESASTWASVAIIAVPIIALVVTLIVVWL
jgi:ATP-dependent Zn protease